MLYIGVCVPVFGSGWAAGAPGRRDNGLSHAGHSQVQPALQQTYCWQKLTHQQSRWHLCESVFKKGHKCQSGTGVRRKKSVTKIPANSKISEEEGEEELHMMQKRFPCSLWRIKCQRSWIFPERTVACGKDATGKA